jgi:hypothetical protein
MVLNQLFSENLPLCIIDGYYQRNIDNLSGTQFCFYMDMLMTCVIPKKKNFKQWQVKSSLDLPPLIFLARYNEPLKQLVLEELKDYSIDKFT